MIRPLLLSLVNIVILLAYDDREFSVEKIDHNGLLYEPDQQYVFDTNGEMSYQNIGDLKTLSSYEDSFNSDKDIVYYLYTRNNADKPTKITPRNLESIKKSIINSNRKIIVLVHGLKSDYQGTFCKIIVSAITSNADVNVLVVDWSRGASTNYLLKATFYAVETGKTVASFLNWLTSASQSYLNSLHLIGHCIGGHIVGIIGRSLNTLPAYITSLDPTAPGWLANPYRLKKDDARYTEVIHTNAAMNGYLAPLGHVDFYPNGGFLMPGCEHNVTCTGSRAIEYLAESFEKGGFEGNKCTFAFLKVCSRKSDPLNMGGFEPKFGYEGNYYLETNEFPPFSKSQQK